ncbi:hypothetical protein ANN_26449 [Periplaneta americana]|uniref:Uncharacterized protein n=1 Tax=Periplaneta americana TaxID=6978 RepID=A0ABQ8RY47_PERAM|nr:hypothetical protein ANN_26449 [Periplaneta americana]
MNMTLKRDVRFELTTSVPQERRSRGALWDGARASRGKERVVHAREAARAAAGLTHIRRPEFECSGPQLEGPEFECSGPQLEGPEFEYSELSLKVCGSRYRELDVIAWEVYRGAGLPSTRHYLKVNHSPVAANSAAIKTFVVDQLPEDEHEAPRHCYGAVRDFLYTDFPDILIGRGGPLAWPPRSPDLNPVDLLTLELTLGRTEATHYKCSWASHSTNVTEHLTNNYIAWSVDKLQGFYRVVLVADVSTAVLWSSSEQLPLAMGDSATSTVLTRYDPCDCDLFAKLKEPLRGTRYNTRDELIRALGRSIRNINKYGRADGVRRLPNIWQKVINKGGDYIEAEFPRDGKSLSVRNGDRQRFGVDFLATFSSDSNWECHGRQCDEICGRVNLIHQIRELAARKANCGRRYFLEFHAVEFQYCHEEGGSTSGAT